MEKLASLKDIAIALTDAATVIIVASKGHHFNLSTAASRTLGAPGTGYNMQTIFVTWKNTSGAGITMILATGSAGSFRYPAGVTALQATPAGAVESIVAKYHATDDRWDVIGYSGEAPAGTAAPGGTSGEVQYNNGGVFAGAANVEISAAGNLRLVATTNPPAPAAGLIDIYGRLLAGRMMPKWMPPSGVDIFPQPALFGNRIVTFNPNTGTVGTGQGLGPAWTSNGTVLHPTPSATAPAVSNQMKRTRYANIVTTTNQQLGPRFNVDSERQFWIGNAAGLGGFFFSARFIVELYPASTVRIFAGLQGASATGSVVISDTVLANTCGLWHDTTDNSSTFNFVTKNATTATKQAIALSNAIAAGNSYEFHMFCAPNGSTISWRLDDVVNNVTYEGSQTLTLPVNTVFMSPQVQMSNGTANITVTTTAIGVAGIYVESDR